MVIRDEWWALSGQSDCFESITQRHEAAKVVMSNLEWYIIYFHYFSV